MMLFNTSLKTVVCASSALWLVWACSSSSTIVEDNPPGGAAGAAGAPPAGGGTATSGVSGNTASGAAAPSAGSAGVPDAGSSGEGSGTEVVGGAAGGGTRPEAGGPNSNAGQTAGAGGDTTPPAAGGSQSAGAAGSPPGPSDAGAGGQENSAGTSGVGEPGGQASNDCASAQRCVPRAAPGWSGPIVLTISSDPVDCPSDYPVLAFDAGTELDAPSAECDCECGALTGSCDNDSVTVNTYSSNDCSGDADEVVSDWETSSCVRFESALFDIAGPTATSCDDPGTVNEMVAQASFGNLVRGCEGATSQGSCGDSGICLPEPEAAFDEMCVYREGEYECPSGYVVGSLVYQDFNDTRGCPNSCSCSASGGECSLAVTTYSGFSGGGLCGDFWGSETISSDESDCVIVSSGAAARFGPPSFVEGSGQCTGESPAPTGSATPTDPITVCCLD